MFAASWFLNNLKKLSLFYHVSIVFLRFSREDILFFQKSKGIGKITGITRTRSNLREGKNIVKCFISIFHAFLQGNKQETMYESELLPVE